MPRSDRFDARMRLLLLAILTLTAALCLACAAHFGRAPLVDRPALARPAPPPASQGSGKHPNVILLLADDLAAGRLGYEGDRVSRTPHLDRLAAEGVSFSRCYVAAPQCSPSRASILTGKYPHRTGVLSNLEPRLPRNAATFARQLKSAGYRCGLVGKWHNGDSRTPDGGFEDFWATWQRGPAKTKNSRPLIFQNGKVHEYERYMTDVLADLAIEFMDQGAAQPFMLTLAFCQPHAPRAFHPDYRFDPAEITLPESISDDLRDKPAAQRRSVAHEYFKTLSPERLKREIAEYYSMIAAIDAAVGRVMAALAERGLERDTLVIFASDNGVLLGQHQMMEKGAAFYDELTRTPLILRQPGVLPAGAQRDAIASLVDLAPTIVARAGLTPPPDIDGVDLWPVASGAARAVREVAFLQYYHKIDAEEPTPMLGAVTTRYKYSRYLEAREEELYDLVADPFERRNLIGVSAAIPELRAMRRRVDDFAAGISPPFWTETPRH